MVVVIKSFWQQRIECLSLCHYPSLSSGSMELSVCLSLTLSISIIWQHGVVCLSHYPSLSSGSMELSVCLSDYPSLSSGSMELPVFLSLSIHCYHPSLVASLLGCILCLHKADGSFCWSANTRMSTCRSSEENVTYDFVLTFSKTAMSYLLLSCGIKLFTILFMLNLLKCDVNLRSLFQCSVCI